MNISSAPENSVTLRPIVVTGGETGIGEVLRGDVLHIDYDYAVEDEVYARAALAAARAAEAPPAVRESLIDILRDEHGVDGSTAVPADELLNGVAQTARQDLRDNDLLVAVAQPGAEEIGGAPGEASPALRERQEAQLGPNRCNAETPAEARECRLRRDGHEALADLRDDGLLAAAAEARLLRIARTLADLAGSDAVSAEQIAEASELAALPDWNGDHLAPAGACPPEVRTPARASRVARRPHATGQNEKGTP